MCRRGRPDRGESLSEQRLGRAFDLLARLRGRAIVLPLGLLILGFVTWRLAATITNADYPPALWLQQLANGLVLGSVYALVAIGYTLVYGILKMINFAHGEVLMLGAMAGYFALDAMASAGWLESFALLAVILTFAAGIAVSVFAGVATERVAYRPLREVPRLVLLISAIGVSIFLQNATQLIVGSNAKVYPTTEVAALAGGQRIAGAFVTNTGIMIVVLTGLMLLIVVHVLRRTRFGVAVRAVAEDIPTARLMGIDVDRVIMLTFVLAAILAGSGGVMLGFHNRQVNHYSGFLPGLKAFTAAVVGGIGNVGGAVAGGFLLGLAESIGPFALGIPVAYKDVIAFSLLVVVLIFRPTGIFGEVLERERA